MSCNCDCIFWLQPHLVSLLVLEITMPAICDIILANLPDPAVQCERRNAGWPLLAALMEGYRHIILLVDKPGNIGALVQCRNVPPILFDLGLQDAAVYGQPWYARSCPACGLPLAAKSISVDCARSTEFITPGCVQQLVDVASPYRPIVILVLLPNEQVFKTECWFCCIPMIDLMQFHLSYCQLTHDGGTGGFFCSHWWAGHIQPEALASSWLSGGPWWYHFHS
jgi:hypothetical protein